MRASNSPKRGRPSLTAVDHMVRAAHILDVAVAARQGRKGYLASLGYTSEAQVARMLTKRYRGAVGSMVNEELAVLNPSINHVAAAVRFVEGLERDHAEAEKPISRALAVKEALHVCVGVDRRNLKRALDIAAARATREGEAYERQRRRFQLQFF